MSYPKTKRGWYNKRPNSHPEFESYRHRLARYGIKTTGLTNQEIKQEHELLMKKLGIQDKERFVQHENTTHEINDDNLINSLLQYEGGEMKNEEFFYLYSFLIKTGRVWQMQGHYGRQARQLMDNGYISANGKINWNKIKEDKIDLKGDV